MKKKYIIIIILLLTIYSCIPLFWPKPKVRLNLPKEVLVDDGLDIQVDVSSWHSNIEFYMVLVELRVNPAYNNGHATKTITLHRGKFRKDWDSMSNLHLSRLTWPRKYSQTFTLPLSELIEDNFIDPDIIKGKVFVRVDYPNTKWMPSIRRDDIRVTKYFTIQLL